HIATQLEEETPEILRPVRDAASREALRDADALQVQALSFLVDVDLPCRAVLQQRLEVFVDSFFQAWAPKPFAAWDPDHAKSAVWALKVDGFGIAGSRFLWDRIGVPEASMDFCARARKEISEPLADEAEALADLGPSAGTSRKHQRVFAYAEYDLEPPPGEAEIRGKMLFENGFRTTRVRADQRWLRPTPLPINSWVDRSLCAEMQMMGVLCSQLQVEGLAEFGNQELNSLLLGRVDVYTSAPPCISCVGSMWQFKRHFPNISFHFSCSSGRDGKTEAWIRR
ncbi:unnamed protein product, partial [Polarella glacialis]